MMMDKFQLALKENSKTIEEADKLFAKLNNKIDEMESKLNSLRIFSKTHITINYEPYPSPVIFGVHKDGSYWRFFVRTHTRKYAWKDCAWELKLALLEHADALLFKIVENNRDALETLRKKLK